MNNYDLKSLNAQQLDALLCTDGAVLVTAGAGSGKTKLLTHKIAYLVKEKHVSPFEILAITFTNKAANEMKTRLGTMLEDTSDMWIMTFHSMCCKILREHIHLLGFNKYFTIYGDSESDKLLDVILTEKGLVDNKKDLKKEIKFHISNCKNANLSISEYEQSILQLQNCEKIVDVFQTYQDYLQKNNAVDFDDLLVLTYKLFKNFPNVLDYYSNRFRYVLVDEFQDTNLVQYDLVKLMSQKHKNVFVVGDEDQCIYTWRGASYQNISKFISELGAKTFKLEYNYRSSPNILDIANKVIKNNTSRIDKTLKATKASLCEPEYFQAYDEEAEAQYVVGKIKKLVSQGYAFKDVAILLRVSAISLAFEQALMSYNVPYVFYGGFKFFERAEIKNLIAYLRLFVNPNDDVSLMRIINFPKRGIGETTVEKLRSQALAKQKSMLDILLTGDYELSKSTKQKLDGFVDVYTALFSEYETLPVEDFVQEVIDRFDLKSAFDPKDKDDYDKLMNFDTFVENTRTFCRNNQQATLQDYLESVTLSSDIDNYDASNDNVILATVHSVKGLEFKVVFIVGAEEKIFPISRAYESNAEMEEERRLMYVAITRAEERLYFTCAKTRYLYGRRDYCRTSRFLREAGIGSVLANPNLDGQSSYDGYKSYDGCKSQYGVFGGGESFSYSKSQDFISKYKSDVMPEQKQTVSKHNDFAVGDKVIHPKYDVGEILSIYEGGKTADVKFEGFGVKTLILDLAPIEKIEV